MDGISSSLAVINPGILARQTSSITISFSLQVEIQMAYWPGMLCQDDWMLAKFSFFFVFMDRDGIEVHKHEKNYYFFLFFFIKNENKNIL